MKRLRLIVYGLLLISARLPAADVPDYARDISPVLNKYCVGCHEGDAAEAELVLATYSSLRQGGEHGPAIDTAEPANSLLLARLTGRVEPAMPPKDEPRPSDAELALLIQWITAGAPGPIAESRLRELHTPSLAPSQAPKPITALAYAPGPGRIERPLAVGRFGQVELIDMATQTLIRNFSTPGKVNGLTFSLDGTKLLAATGIAGLRGEAILWNVSDGQQLKSFSGHTDTLYAAELSHAGSMLATASYDGQVIIWDVDSGDQLRTLTGHNGAVYDLKFSPGDRVLASASADATVKIWRVDTGQRLDTLSQPLKEQYSVDISPDGKYIVAGGEDNRIRMWRLISDDTPLINPIVHARFAHDGAIQQVRFSPDGEHVVSVAADNTLKIWSARALQQVHVYPSQPDSSPALAISRDNQLAVGRMDGSLDEYPLETTPPRIETEATTQVARSVGLDTVTASITESEPNDGPASAEQIHLPAIVTGHINSPIASPDVDFFRFSALAGQTWLVEVNAARRESSLDSHVTILHEDGRPVPRVQLQAVRDAYFTFRGKDSDTTGDFRLHNWEEMKLNQYLYCAGEVVKLFHYPRGPDSGFNVYPNFGKRRGYFDTTPLAHALNETCYIVEPHPPTADLPPNGLPTFMLNFENDDDSQRRLGKDSRLTFVAPADGDYLVKLRDVRGLQGEDYQYELAIRPPKPDFSVRLLNADIKVARGAGRKFGVEAERIDGFNGPVSVAVHNLPAGFSVAGPLVIEAGHDRAWATLLADKLAKSPSEEESAKVTLTASAKIGDAQVEYQIGSLGKLALEESSPLIVELLPDHEASRAGDGVPVIELAPGSTTTATILVQRNGYEGRINFGNEDGAVNSPHGVYVDNIGLNGVLIVEGQNQRQFFITAEPWVPPMERWIFVEASEAGSPTSAPVLLRVLPKQALPDEEASR